MGTELILAITNVITPIISSVVTWRVSKKKRDNNFLADLQRSIDLLSDKYTEALEELTNTRAVNIDLIAQIQKQTIAINDLKEDVGKLQRENEKLIQQNNKLVQQNNELKKQQVKLTKEISELKKKLENDN